MQFRQGDVFIEALRGKDAKVPAGAVPVPRDRGRVVLVYGEATGHAHAIADEGAALYRPWHGTDLILRVIAATGVRLAHEEHDTIVLPRGTYVVRRQREYDPQPEGAGQWDDSRYVAD